MIFCFCFLCFGVWFCVFYVFHFDSRGFDVFHYDLRGFDIFHYDFPRVDLFALAVYSRACQPHYDLRGDSLGALSMWQRGLLKLIDLGYF